MHPSGGVKAIARTPLSDGSAVEVAKLRAGEDLLVELAKPPRSLDDGLAARARVVFDILRVGTVAGSDDLANDGWPNVFARGPIQLSEGFGEARGRAP